MNRDALQALRDRLAEDQPVHGLWVTMAEASVTEMAVGLGLDWVVLDAEHGHLDWRDLVAHVRATVRSRTVCLIRIAQLDHGLIKRALDIGADGVVVPWIERPEQVAMARQQALYPPVGRRGIGAERATCWGRALAEHVQEAAAVLVVPLIESVAGGEAAAAIAAEPGLELCFIGPADWSATAGHPGTWMGGTVASQIEDTVRVLRAQGIHAGVIAGSADDLRDRRRQGFRMLGLGIDGALLLRGLETMLPATGTLPVLATDLRPRQEGTAARPLAQIPPSLRPSRPEILLEIDGREPLAVDDGIEVWPLAGTRTGSTDLCTALVRLAPGGSLVPHRHREPETVVVLTGTIETVLQGRRHRIGAGQAITIPAGAAHRTGNASTTTEAVIHVALPAAGIQRTLVAPADWDEARLPHAEPAPARATWADGEEHTVHAPTPLRLRTLALSRGEPWAARLHAVGCALFVTGGAVRLRTATAVHRLGRWQGTYLPPGTPYELTAEEAGTTVIQTCADVVALDALVQPALLTPLPAPAALAATPSSR